MEIKKIGTFETNVAVDINKDDVIKILHEQLGVPKLNKAYDSFDPAFVESLYIKKDGNGVPIGVYKKIDHYRNTGRGEGKFDYSEEILITDDKYKVDLYDAYLCVTNALCEYRKISQ